MGLADRLRGRSDEKPQPKGESGKEGDEYTDEQMGGGDLNPALQGSLKYDVYDEMRRTDAAVKAALLMFKLPIRQASWAHKPASESPLDELVAVACDAQFGLGGMDGWISNSFDEQLIQELLYLDYGAMGEEMVWGEELIDWAPDAGTTRPYRPIVKLGARYPRTVDKIETAPDGTISWLKQNLPKTSPIPGRKLHWLVNEREGASWFGQSVLRQMYGPWRLKKALMISSGIGWDRYAAGVPIVRYPEGGGADAERKAQEIGRNYRVHERAWVALEGAPPPVGGWSVEILSGNGSLADPTTLLRFYDEQIAKGALQTFSNLGTTAQGSRAAAQVIDDPYYLALTATAQYVANQRRKRLLRAFVTENFGADVPTPFLVVTGIEQDNIFQVAETIALLASAQWNTTHRELQDAVWERLGLPLLPAGESPRVEGEDLDPTKTIEKTRKNDK